MSGAPIVAAYGHMFRDLAIETEVLARDGIELVDGNPLGEEAIGGLGVSGILLGAFKRLERAQLRRLPQCRGVVRYGIGVDNVDLAAADEAHIVVCNVPDYCIEEVAVHVLACALALMRGLPYWDRAVRAGAWRGKQPPVLRRPSSSSLGIIGFGQIGRLLEQRAQPTFGAILVHDPWFKADASMPLGPRTRRVEDLDLLLAEADVVSVHVPLTAATANMLDEAALRRMRRGAFVINASRGGIVDEQALIRCVREGHLAGAALDTFASEPLPPGHELLGENRILLTPHVAWISEQAEVALRRGAAEEMARILTGRAPRSQIRV